MNDDAVRRAREDDDAPVKEKVSKVLSGGPHGRGQAGGERAAGERGSVLFHASRNDRVVECRNARAMCAMDSMETPVDDKVHHTRRPGERRDGGAEELRLDESQRRRAASAVLTSKAMDMTMMDTASPTPSASHVSRSMVR